MRVAGGCANRRGAKWRCGRGSVLGVVVVVVVLGSGAGGCRGTPAARKRRNVTPPGRGTPASGINKLFVVCCLSGMVVLLCVVPWWSLYCIMP